MSYGNIIILQTLPLPKYHRIFSQTHTNFSMYKLLILEVWINLQNGEFFEDEEYDLHDEKLRDGFLY